MQLRHAFDADTAQRGNGLVRESKRGNRKARDRFKGAARRDNRLLAKARHGPSAARCVGERGLGGNPFSAEPAAKVLQQHGLAVKEMRRPRDIDEHAIRRIWRHQRRIFDAPGRKPPQALLRTPSNQG